MQPAAVSSAGLSEPSDPDLAGKIQVGLFNIMQEGDVQIKGYPLRLPLDVLLVFTANPEDYTARGKIITPLKDRLGAEIRTHYPTSIEDGITITGVRRRCASEDDVAANVSGVKAQLADSRGGKPNFFGRCTVQTYRASKLAAPRAERDVDSGVAQVKVTNNAHSE